MIADSSGLSDNFFAIVVDIWHLTTAEVQAAVRSEFTTKIRECDRRFMFITVKVITCFSGCLS